MIAKKLFIVISSFLVLFVPITSFAQTPLDKNFDVTVSPTFIELSTKPGSTITQSIKLRNNSNNLITVKPEIRIMGGNEQGELTIKDTKEEYISWLKVKDESIALKPKEWSTINFSIEVPESAAFGYYWALSFTASDTKINSQTGSTLTASLAVPILLNVQKDGAKTEGKLIDFKSDRAVYEYPPIKFVTQFQNTGNVHIKPIGNIFIKDFFGKTVGTLLINEGQGNVLPGLNRTFESTWNDGFITYEPKMKDGIEVKDKDNKVQYEMKIHYQKLLDLRIGKYTATSLVNVVGQDRDYTYEKSISFFVFPWKVVLVLIGIAIFVGIGLFTTSRSIIRKIKGLFKKK